ncbi:hypothetical protein Tco_0887223 [Tanacetum coccineum]
MLLKQSDPKILEKKVNIKPINYADLNQLSEDFGKRFVPQQELSDEQAFRLQTSHPNTDQSASSPVKIKASRELLKVSLVNTSLKKLKYYLGQFDNVVKKRITPNALTEGEWGYCTEYGILTAHLGSIFGQDLETFTGTMFLNMDQLEKKLDNEEFQEIRSMAAFKVLETQFQLFIKLWIYLDDEYVVMTHNYFLQYTQLEILEFRDILIHHMEFVKKSIDERAHHKREYDSRVNDRQMQITEEKVDTSKALDDSLVDTESSGTISKEQDTNSRSRNDAHADDADIRPIYDEEPMAEVQTTAEINELLLGNSL